MAESDASRQEQQSVFHVVCLRDVDRGRDNNLNLTRFLLASAVIFSHSYVSMGLYDLEPLHHWLGVSDFGSMAVFSFFFISGYLILKSGLQWRSPEDFILSRVLRIFPGLLVTVLVCALVLGPLLSTLPVHAYFKSPLTWAFLSEAWMNRMQHLLPGVCQNYTLPSLDGQLWTLPGEWTMYMAVLLVCLVVHWRASMGLRLRTWLVVLGSLILTAQMMPLPWPFAFNWIKYFALGSAAYLARRWVLLQLPACLALFVACMLFTHRHPHMGMRLLPLALGYLLLTIGYHPAAHLRFFHSFGDYSYGLYIFGQPVQQSFLPRFQHPLPFFAAAYPVVLVAAMLSWHLVEQPALSLKDKLKRARWSSAEMYR